MGKVLGIVWRTIATRLTRKAGFAKTAAQTGPVTLIQRFGSEWYQTAWDLFPEWHSDRKAFDLALNLCQQLMEGMAISNFTHARKIDRQTLLDYLEEKVGELKPTR